MYDISMKPMSRMQGRGAATNPPNRFEELHVEADPDLGPDEVQPAPGTRFYRDATKTVLTRNDSPDLGFAIGLNPYRGCEHGCAYCYARPYHEYLGLSAGLDFETRIWVKTEAPVLLRRELSQPGWQPQTVWISGVTDCYQPAERRFRLTRACLEVLADARNPVGLITKNELITRDVDVLQPLARLGAAAATLSITTLDPQLSARLEPRASAPLSRLRAISQLAQAGIPVGVNVAPIIPGLTDLEMPAILQAAADAGATFAHFTLLRLPHAVKDIFAAWLETHRPLAKEKILSRIRETHGGKLYDARFGARMSGQGAYAEQLRQWFEVARRKAGLEDQREPLTARHFRRPEGPQLTLF